MEEYINIYAYKGGLISQGSRHEQFDSYKNDNFYFSKTNFFILET